MRDYLQCISVDRPLSPGAQRRPSLLLAHRFSGGYEHGAKRVRSAGDGLGERWLGISLTAKDDVQLHLATFA